jgi:hypothetical protein
MSVLGACWRQAKVEKQGIFWKEKHKAIFGKESMHKESDSWKEEQHAHGRKT